MTQSFDVVVIGGGHNGLVCAWYLARAGHRVCVLEARSVLGGAAVTEEFAPGFRNSTASYTVSLLQPRVIADMRLREHGLRIVERPVANFLPLPDGRSLTAGGGLERTQAEFAKFSARDAAALPAYQAELDAIADVLRALALTIPPNAGEGILTLVDAVRASRPFARLTIEQQRTLLELFTRSATEVLERWFESEPVQALFGFDSVVGNHAGPSTPGSAYVLLHHVFGEVNGVKGGWGHAIGGMGSITQAMATACREAGVTLRTDAPVAKVLVNGGRVVGVALASGEEVIAPRVVANVGPKPLYERLVAPADLSPEFRQRMAHFRVGSGTFRMNVALSGLPRFTAKPEAGEHLSAGIILAPSLAYMDQAFDEAKRDGWSRNPVVEMLIPSTLDDSLAPAGAHVASLFCQGFSPTLPAGRSWTDERDAAADAIIDVVDRYAPGFRELVIAQQLHSPADLEAQFGLAGGDIFHGRMSLDQLWASRPMLGHGSYRGPIAGLWMCGAGTHPGGGVTGAPGYNAAQAILRAERWPRWWRRR